jgi:hypothetical protein
MDDDFIGQEIMLYLLISKTVQIQKSAFLEEFGGILAIKCWKMNSGSAHW